MLPDISTPFNWVVIDASVLTIFRFKGHCHTIGRPIGAETDTDWLVLFVPGPAFLDGVTAFDEAGDTCFVVGTTAVI